MLDLPHHGLGAACGRHGPLEIKASISAETREAPFVQAISRCEVGQKAKPPASRRGPAARAPETVALLRKRRDVHVSQIDSQCTLMLVSCRNRSISSFTCNLRRLSSTIRRSSVER